MLTGPAMLTGGRPPGAGPDSHGRGALPTDLRAHQGHMLPAGDLGIGRTTPCRSSDLMAPPAVWGMSAVMRAQGCPAEAAQLIQRARRDHAGEPSLDREAGYIA